MISSKKITLIAIVLVAVAMAFVIAIMITTSQTAVVNTTDFFTGDVKYSDAHTVSFTADDYYSNYSNTGVAKINLNGVSASSSSRNVRIDGSEITIMGGGTYVLSGEISDGSIIVDSADDAVVRLVLNGVNVTSSDFAALYVKQAEKVVLSSVEGTENIFTDGSAYNEKKLTDGAPDAAVYSADDMTINGNGTIIVNGNYRDGIKANDTLKITQGTVKVNGADDGINVNDYIAMSVVNVEINAAGDAVKCENESSDKGFIALEKTDIKIVGGDDGVVASSSVYANGITAQLSVKGDAIYGGKDVVLDVNSVNITECTEGIEGGYITINGGDFRIIAADDGINALGLSSNGGRPMMGRHDVEITEENTYLIINGGNIYMESSGDGVDSNGAAVMNGGHVEVYGPENSGNSSLDFEYGFVINGGTLLAAGSSGMAELPSENSEQNSIVFYLDENYNSGSKISVCDADGNELISGTSNKRFNWVCVSMADMADGGTYTLKINDTEPINVEVSGVVTSYGRSGRGGFGR